MNVSLLRFLLFAGVVTISGSLVSEYLHYTRERNAIVNAFYNIQLHNRNFVEASAGTESPILQQAAFEKMSRALRALDLEACPSEFLIAYDEFVDATEEMSDLLGEIVQVEAGVNDIEGRQFISGLYKIASGLSAVPSSAARAEKCGERQEIALRKMRRIAAGYGLQFTKRYPSFVASK